MVGAFHAFNEICTDTMRVFCLIAAVGLALVSAWACKPFDDDLAYVPKYNCDFLLYETDSGSVLARYADGVIDTLWGGWSGNLDLSNATAVSLHPEYQMMANCHHSPSRVYFQGLGRFSSYAKSILLSCQPVGVSFGRKNALVISSDDVCSSLSFFEYQDVFISDNPYSISLNYRPLAVVYRQGRFIVASDTCVYIYSDDALALLDSISLTHPFRSMTPTAGYGIVILGQQADKFYTQNLDLNALDIPFVLNSTAKNIEYSPLQKSQFEMEFLGYLSINNLGILEVKPSNLQPFPVQAYTGPASALGLDYMGARVFFQRSDSLFVNELQTGVIRLVATGVRRFKNSASYYQIGN